MVTGKGTPYPSLKSNFKRKKGKWSSLSKLYPTTFSAENKKMMRPPRASTFDQSHLELRSKAGSYRAASTTKTCRTLSNDQGQKGLVRFAAAYGLPGVPTVDDEVVKCHSVTYVPSA